MLYINESNKNEMITLEEANEILKIANRVHGGILSELYVKEDDSFYFEYKRNYKWCIAIQTSDIDSFDKTSEEIIAHVNNEFNSNIAHSRKAKSINAFCHEIGHAIERMSKLGLDPCYESNLRDDYEFFYDYVDEIQEELYWNEPDDYWMTERECYNTDEEYEEHLKRCQQYQELEAKLYKEIDHKYRMIPTEYAADEFSARFMKTYLGYLDLFEN